MDPQHQIPFLFVQVRRDRALTLLWSTYAQYSGFVSYFHNRFVWVAAYGTPPGNGKPWRAISWLAYPVAGFYHEQAVRQWAQQVQGPQRP